MALTSSHRTGVKDFSIRSEINVTPLVDVCLVLLIIFMVVTPMLDAAVALPETNAPDRMPERARELDVTIQQNGSVYLDEQWVPASDLPAALRRIYQQASDRHVVVTADRHLTYGEVRDVMRLVNRAGWSGAGVETRRREDRPVD